MFLCMLISMSKLLYISPEGVLFICLPGSSFEDKYFY